MSCIPEEMGKTTMGDQNLTVFHPTYRSQCSKLNTMQFCVIQQVVQMKDFVAECCRCSRKGY